MPVALNIEVPPSPTTVSRAEANDAAEVVDLASTLESLSLAPSLEHENSSTAEKGRIIVHCIRHAEVSSPSNPNFHLNSLTAFSRPSAIFVISQTFTSCPTQA